jgi:hypothetical protein
MGIFLKRKILPGQGFKLGSVALHVGIFIATLTRKRDSLEFLFFVFLILFALWTNVFR